MREPQDPEQTSGEGASAKSSASEGRRGSHSRPLGDKPDNDAKAVGSRSHASHAKKPSVSHTDEDSAKGSEPADDAKEKISNGSKSASSKAEEKPAKSKESSAGEHDGDSNKREVIVPDDAFEPTSMVDTSANTQQVKQRQVFRENPNIYYMNGESLSRPMTLPPSAKIGIIVIIIIATVFASIAFYMYFDATTNEPAREQARMKEQLSRNVSLDLPDMLSLLELDDATIDAQLKATGDTYFERSAVDSSEDYEIVKLPSDVTLVDAAAMYAEGISKLTPSQAATLLNGSWDLMITRNNGLDMALHYADFQSGSEAAAIENAIAAEDLSRGTITDSGDNDGYGNHYTQGTIMINGKIYDWIVSAIELKDVYSIAGLPDDAVYVGIRIKGTAE